MCFSASASLSASAILVTVGIYSLYKAKDKSEYTLASVPVLFATQQFAEGLNWLHLESNPGITSPFILSFVFLFIAYVVWPSYIPITAHLFEKDKVRKNLIKPVIAIGVILSLYLLYLITMGTIGASIQENHIKYSIVDVTALPYIKYVYLTVVTVPFFLVKKKASILYGLFIFGSFVITNYVSAATFVSVWCFFAAIISFTIGLHFFFEGKKRIS